MMPKVYCAGPLFNKAEKEEMSAIERVLRDAGCSTFLPHRDGLEFSQVLPAIQRLGLDAGNADRILQRAIFSLDLYQLLSWSDAVVANLNGRVPDEGTVVEASLAWHSGKALILYKADARSVLNGSDNPMLTGLANFQIVNDIQEIPATLSEQLRSPHHERIAATLEFGAQIAAAMKMARGPMQIAHLLMNSAHE